MNVKYHNVAADLLRQIVRARGFLNVTANGSSMLPTIHDGCVVRVTPVTEKVNPGSIVMLSNESGYLIHRVVALNTDGKLITKGDNLPTIDEAFDSKTVIGEVTSVKTPNGWQHIGQHSSFEGKVISRLSIISGCAIRLFEQSGKTVVKSLPSRMRVSRINSYIFKNYNSLINYCFMVAGKVTRQVVGSL